MIINEVVLSISRYYPHIKH